MDLEGIMLSETSQRERNATGLHLHTESLKKKKKKNHKLTDTRNRLVAKVRRVKGRLDEMGEGDQKAQTSVIK